MLFLKWVWERVQVALPVLRWVAHAAAVLVTLYLLWVLNSSLRLDLILLSPFPRLHGVWLPLLYVLFYLLAWQAWWLYRALAPERDGGEFTDIDKAWDEASGELEAAGVDPTTVPLFLVFGRPAGGFEDVFAASGVPMLVRNVPAGRAAPLRVFGGRHGVFVTCEGASLLGEHLRTGPAAPEPDAEPPAPLAPEELERRAKAEDIRQEARYLSVSLFPEPMSVYREANEEVRDLFGEPPPPDPRAAIVRTDVVERANRRLQYLCRKIARRREPYCPANGLLWLIPSAELLSPARSGRAAIACRRDLAAARASLMVECPSVVLVPDAQALPGFGELLAVVPPGEPRRRHVGQTFPLLPDLPPAEHPAALEAGLRWVDGSYFPSLVYGAFGAEADAAGRWPAARTNLQLFRAMAAVRRLRPGLERVAARGLCPEPPLLAGCYLGAAPADADGQAFVAGAVRQLFAGQNAVLWTADAKAEERTFTRLAWAGWAAIAGLWSVLGTAAVAAWR